MYKLNLVSEGIYSSAWGRTPNEAVRKNYGTSCKARPNPDGSNAWGLVVYTTASHYGDSPATILSIEEVDFYPYDGEYDPLAYDDPRKDEELPGYPESGTSRLYADVEPPETSPGYDRIVELANSLTDYTEYVITGDLMPYKVVCRDYSYRLYDNQSGKEVSSEFGVLVRMNKWETHSLKGIVADPVGERTPFYPARDALATLVKRAEELANES
jgi:hypothetical protein